MPKKERRDMTDQYNQDLVTAAQKQAVKDLEKSVRENTKLKEENKKLEAMLAELEDITTSSSSEDESPKKKKKITKKKISKKKGEGIMDYINQF
jgi:regulator of replication initiation timing